MSKFPVKYKSPSPVNLWAFGDSKSTGFGLLGTDVNNKRDLNNRIIRMKLDRIRQDISSWRDAVSEAENSFFPSRLAMQRLFLDTVLNGHVKACMNKRKNLTLLKEFAVTNKAGTVNEEVTELFKAQWFDELMNYALEAQFYGYTHLNWTQVFNNQLGGLQLIKRQNISPDREMVLPFPNSFIGFSLFEQEDLDWSLWIPTPSDNGISNCGYGLLYNVAPYEIYLRNLMGYNGDFVELFAQPFRVGKTSKTQEDHLAEFDKVLNDMGSSAWARIDPTDEIEFKNENGGGNGYKAYESFQARCEKTISKIILGHDSAIDAIPGKLGTGDGETTAQQMALNEIEAIDNKFIEYVINDKFLDKLRNLGFKIPADVKFKFLNNREEAAAKDSASNSNKKVADIVKTLSDSGYKVTPEWIKEQTQIDVKEAEVAAPTAAENFSKEIQNKLKQTYGTSEL